jgi:hypothetical protein
MRENYRPTGKKGIKIQERKVLTLAISKPFGGFISIWDSLKKIINSWQAIF